jgi:pimeloyl-ACP methyl ester carboxylesterase
MGGDVSHRSVEANGIHLRIAELGEGPAVLLCHGFPESWYSWRHQLAALAAAGFHAIAPDMRGYGRSDRPEAIEQYTLLHLVGDMVGLLDALGIEQVAIAGHDWGAPVAWHAALLRPDRFRAVVGLSVPHRPRSAVVPTSVMPRRDDAVFYQLYFQTPGVAEAEFERDVRTSLAKILYAASGDAPRPPGAGGGEVAMVPRDGGFLTRMPFPSTLPAWLSAADLDFYAGEFARSGFRGGLNWYRNIDRSWSSWRRSPMQKSPYRRSTWPVTATSWSAFATWTRRLPICRPTCRSCAARSFFPAAATGPSRSAPPRSAPR